MGNSSTKKVKSASYMFSSPSCALLAQMGFSFEGTWWSSCHPFSVVPAEAIEEKTHYLVLRAKLAWYPLLLFFFFFLIIYFFFFLIFGCVGSSFLCEGFL